MPSNRQKQIEEVTDALRASQSTTEVFDERAAEQLGINRTDLRCLEIIERLGSVSAGQLAEESRLTTGAVTAVIDRLERAGLARRVDDPADRRRVIVELTDSRTSAPQIIWGPLQAAAEREWKRYSKDELDFLLQFWTRGPRDAAGSARETGEAAAVRGLTGDRLRPMAELPVQIDGIEGMQAQLGRRSAPRLGHRHAGGHRHFAELCGDDQWIHVDVERAKTESPFGTTIAHGNLTLSMIDGLRLDLFESSGFLLGVNYGWNKVRFPAPVPAGARVARAPRSWRWTTSAAGGGRS